MSHSEKSLNPRSSQLSKRWRVNPLTISSVCPEDPYFSFAEPDSYNPQEVKYKNMLRLIAYDITNAKRLRKVALLCLDFGFRVEYSVFECDLSEELFKSFWMRLHEIIDLQEDRVIIYSICATCVSRIESCGSVSRPQGKTLLYVI